MATPIHIKSITVEEIERLEAENGRFYELIDGELQEKEMASPLHGNIESRLSVFIGSFVLANKLGDTYGSSCSYLLRGTPEKPELVYLPDFSYVAAERVKNSYKGFYQLAPDLAVEVISSSERPKAVDKKLQNYLGHGVKQVWHVYPERKQLIVYNADGSSQTYEAHESISGGEILPNFELKLADLFG